MWEDAFASFCGGLAANSTLRQLDLRNNQISHKGAEELALALKGNTTLRHLGEASWTLLYPHETRAHWVVLSCTFSLAWAPGYIGSHRH